jgi:hypothetical protein
MQNGIDLVIARIGQAQGGVSAQVNFTVTEALALMQTLAESPALVARSWSHPPRTLDARPAISENRMGSSNAITQLAHNELPFDREAIR